MNVTGNAAYNKSASALRQPSTAMDQHHKLIFIYPMLISNSLQKYSQTIRDFHSANMLKEIFISNSLNLVSMSSKIQAPLEKDRVNVGELVGNAILSLQNNNNQQTPQVMDFGTKSELQQRVIEKSERIKDYLSRDSQLNSFNPHIDFITLENLIDVPVIVGSKVFNVDDVSMLMILVASVAMNKPLNSDANIDSVIQTIKTTNTQDFYKLLNNLIQDPYQQNWFTQKLIQSKSLFKRVLPQRVRNRLQNRPTSYRKKRETKESDDIDAYDFNQSSMILKFTQKDLDQARIFFKFMLNSTLFQSQFGVDPNAGQMSDVVQKINPEINQITSTMLNQFINLVAMVGTPILRSVSNVIFPQPSSSDFDFLRIKEKHIDVELNNTINQIIQEDIISALTKSIESSSAEEADKKIKLVKSICSDISKTEEILTKNFSRISDTRNYRYVGLTTFDFDMNNLKQFASELENLSSSVSSFNRSFQTNYDKLVDTSHNVFSRAAEKIRNCIDNFFQVYTDELHQPNTVANADRIGLISTDHIEKRFIPQVKDALFVIFFFFLLYRLQVAMCQLVDFIEIKVEAAAKDVVEWPNYVLILPVEFIQFLHTVIMAKTWKKLIKSEDFNPAEAPSITEQYVKSIVKFVAKRLQVPNLIVIDEKKQEVYYKFMNMSQIHKTKLSTMKTFISQQLK